MGPVTPAAIDEVLRSGGLVVAASERAARALSDAFHRARRAEGLQAWPAPAILDWQTFLRQSWDGLGRDGRLLLSPAQERSIWAQIVGSSDHIATLLEGPRNRMAALAMEAHKLLCSYAPRFLRAAARAGWQQDAANFSAWLSAFEEACRAGSLLSAARLPLELTALLEASPANAQSARPPLLLAGFDRILPTQRRLFDAWGTWKQTAASEPTRDIRFYQAADAQSEETACALWCRRQRAANPRTRLLVVTQDVAKRRGEIERTFLKVLADGAAALSAPQLFEFSLGLPLSQLALPRGAGLLLRWLTGVIDENEVDWLLSTGQIAADAEESQTLTAYMRALRRRGLERPQWTLDAFLNQQSDSRQLPAAWVNRIHEARRRLASFAGKQQSPLEWAEFVPHLLQTAGWPGARPLSSAEFQALRRWQQCLDDCASLGFDSRRIRWQEFLSLLGQALNDTLFAPESHDAPIQISGPAESAGLAADAIWFCGATEDAWPAGGSTHPLLPIEVQREAAMPHATSQLDWELARAVTNRLLASAPEVCFSYARQSEDVEARPSRLIAQLADPAQPLPPDLIAPSPSAPLTVAFEDHSRIPFPPGKVDGGSAVLTAQSQCPFKAFATARLGAQGWEPAESGLTPAQRGQLLHAVLHAVWAGPPAGIRSLKDLQSLPDTKSFAAVHVANTMRLKLPASLRERLPHRYLELEELRLTRLVGEWLDYESTRLDFQVAETELKHTVPLADLTFDLRLDRIDRLNDNSLLVVDYKTGDVSPKSWDLPRPDDVQLPLYAGFALDPDEVLGGLVFAKVRPGNLAFAGRVGDAKATLLPNLGPASTLVKAPLAAEQLIDWRDCIEQLARDFLAGRAEVDPRDYPKTCEHCGLQSLCRIQENPPLPENEEQPIEDAEATNDY